MRHMEYPINLILGMTVTLLVMLWTPKMFKIMSIAHAQGLQTPSGMAYVEIDAATAYHSPVIGYTVGIRGVVLGAGRGFIDIRATLGGEAVRCTWTWSTRPGKGAVVMCVGELSQPGRLATREVVINLVKEESK